MKNTLESSIHDYPGVWHEHEMMRKKLAVVAFMSLPDPIYSIHGNQEIFFINVVKHSHDGKFYGDWYFMV